VLLATLLLHIFNYLIICNAVIVLSYIPIYSVKYHNEQTLSNFKHCKNMSAETSADISTEKPEASTVEEFLDNPDIFSLKSELLNSYIEVTLTNII